MLRYGKKNNNSKWVRKIPLYVHGYGALKSSYKYIHMTDGLANAIMCLKA